MEGAEPPRPRLPGGGYATQQDVDAVHFPAAGALLLFFAWTVARRPKQAEGPVALTVGDVRAMHAEVWAGDREVRGSDRLSDGDTVKTGPDGRAKVKLDDGTLLTQSVAIINSLEEPHPKSRPGANSRHSDYS